LARAPGFAARFAHGLAPGLAGDLLHIDAKAFDFLIER
jgi:hypothetical protein